MISERQVLQVVLWELLPCVRYQERTTRQTPIS